MENTVQLALMIIKSTLWGTESISLCLDDVEKVFTVLKAHAICALPADIVKKASMSEELRSKWNKMIIQNIYRYHNIVFAQKAILSALANNNIPVVVLKGTSVSQYYPIPEYRTMGDIDLLVKHEDFERAKDAILSCGYIIGDPDHSVDRHVSLEKGDIEVELHWRFASENVIRNPEEFDEILLSDIASGRTVLSDPVNGLVLLEHIAQHMNNGIGLRQIIDWMMYVHQYLNDDNWEQRFRMLAEKVGLEKLAVNVTRMCQIFLGLTEDGITWCQNADEGTCNNLMDYIISCGNFGNSRSRWSSGEITKIPMPNHPVQLLRYLKKRGEVNMEISRKNRALKPFAGLAQMMKYIKMLIQLRFKGITVKKLHDERLQRKDLFRRLGITINGEFDNK